MAPTRKVLSKPDPEVTIKPIHSYNVEQQAMIDSLRKYTSTITLPPSDPYHQWEQRWLSRPDTHPRYMRAAKWIPSDAENRIKATLEWRREFQPDLISPEEVRIEGKTGKIILNGFDRDGRPILYMRPGLENTETSPRQLRHLVWWLERAKDLMPVGQETLVIIVDYKSCSLRNNPSISIARKVLHILQAHYVETLGRALVTNLPFILNFFYKGISPFLDPVTRDKMRFNPKLIELIPEKQLDKEFGGSYEFEFEPTSYWDQIIEICNIAPDGTRTGEPFPSSTDHDELSGPLNGLRLEGGDSRARTDSSGTESDSPITPKTPRSVRSFNVKKTSDVIVEEVEEDRVRDVTA